MNCLCKKSVIDEYEVNTRLVNLRTDEYMTRSLKQDLNQWLGLSTFEGQD